MTPFERGFIKAAIEAGVPKEGIGNILKSLGNKATDGLKSLGNKATDSLSKVKQVASSPLSVPAPDRPSYMTNVVNGYKANLDPQAEQSDLLKHTFLSRPWLSSAVGNSFATPKSVILGTIGSNTNSVSNESAYAHELGHKYDFNNIRPQGLSTYFNTSSPPEHMQRELAASVNAKKILGTNYNQNHEATLAKALSTYLREEARRQTDQPEESRADEQQLSPFEAALSRNTATIPEPPANLDFQNTNAFPGHEALQQYAHKLMNDSYNAAYPAKPVDPQIAHLSRYLLH